MKLNVTLLAIVILWSIAGCSNDEVNREGESPARKPEEVVRLYQDNVDKNRFEQAKALSTPEEQRRLDELAGIISQEVSDSTILHTRFLSIDCWTKQDTVRCFCEVEDEYEKYETVYTLVLQNGRWLIDAPRDDFELKDEALENMLKN